MLAYVFWHWPNADVDRDTYEDGLIDFHRTLSEHKPAGFQYSAAFRIERVPWLGDVATAYEDWYLVDGSGALDVLNDAAISYPRKESHDRAAQRAAGGTAGLYRLRRGELDLQQARFAAWLAKPAGTSYDDFYALLSESTSKSGAGLWGRQMTLGPTTEFCLQSAEEISLPNSLSAVTVALEPVWTGA
jgi:hypothetical protein